MPLTLPLSGFKDAIIILSAIATYPTKPQPELEEMLANATANIITSAALTTRSNPFRHQTNYPGCLLPVVRALLHDTDEVRTNTKKRAEAVLALAFATAEAFDLALDLVVGAINDTIDQAQTDVATNKDA